ncbi:MAG TPA: hypothetical protein VLM37_00685, partial [Fibrobacteraceae bacterium]|nr:hypothetical protein [Fibrobacteraceae bacterium]
SQVAFPLAPVYKRKGIEFHQAAAKAIYPEGDIRSQQPFVEVEYTGDYRKGEQERIPYDYLINATGPKLNFAATEGLGPEKFTQSVCTFHHAEQTWKVLQKVLEKMQAGERQKLVIGMGHPMATCQGAGFEYALNVAFEIRKRGLSHLAEILWLTNEYEVGDFGMGGAYVNRGGYITSTRVFTESILAEYGIRWIKRAGVTKVESGLIHYETLDGNQHTQPFDFSMLIPAFAGVGLQAFDAQGKEITAELFLPNGLMKVDAIYDTKPYAQWSASDWPSTYQAPKYSNIFAAGIAFGPPHPISKPFESRNGTKIFPTPPRTGMPSGVIGKIVAQNIAESIRMGKTRLNHRASMGKMGAACIVSSGYGLFSGMAATMTVFPIVPDYEKYPRWGRDISYTVGEPGLAGHWLKHFMHHMFLYKAKGLPGWSFIPE